MPEDAMDDPFAGLRLDEAFVRDARALEPSCEDRLRGPERRIISLDEERARRGRRDRGLTGPQAAAAAATPPRAFLALPSPRAVALLASLFAAALLLGGLPPFLR